MSRIILRKQLLLTAIHANIDMNLNVANRNLC